MYTHRAICPMAIAEKRHKEKEGEDEDDDDH
jgi:hypothetical protein